MTRQVENGYVNPYPHADFDSPCAGPCCVPEAYDSHPWTCEGDECDKLLKHAGLCVPCTEKRDGPLHYWGWSPNGPARRCGAKEGRCAGSAQSTTCPACLSALAKQLEGRCG